ncbi:Meiotic nuclear division protein 1 [Lodderomyces elongisporus]|uniref:Meiotic nuclear division protein 1 n=1 Tax=Lodderomyces elongisporus TaxID=36914 RepID=UPI002921A452|nr:Meiotic nuclear division protein 1 [Lodderomyces elongisporus]WLF79038.1 Meiotic nuclear division protein 1 [Lodderomyces elongisporus]
MPTKKGQSLEEKLAALHAWFQSNHEFYTLKEIEQRGSKACKISSMQIKDLVVNLVNEGLVQQEKCGTTNLYWSFGFTQHKLKLDRVQKLKEECMSKEGRIQQLQTDLDALYAERDVAKLPNRAEELQRLECLKQQLSLCKKQHEQFQDLEKIEHLKKGIDFFNELIENIVCYVSERAMVSQAEIRNEFNIPFELEDPPEMSKAN